MQKLNLCEGLSCNLAASKQNPVAEAFFLKIESAAAGGTMKSVSLCVLALSTYVETSPEAKSCREAEATGLRGVRNGLPRPGRVRSAFELSSA